MNQDTLFQTLTTHCFYGCGHKTQGDTATGSSDAMERHYWDHHYTPDARAELRASGQAESRRGTKV